MHYFDMNYNGNNAKTPTTASVSFKIGFPELDFKDLVDKGDCQASIRIFERIARIPVTSVLARRSYFPTTDTITTYTITIKVNSARLQPLAPGANHTDESESATKLLKELKIINAAQLQQLNWFRAENNLASIQTYEQEHSCDQFRGVQKSSSATVTFKLTFPSRDLRDLADKGDCQASIGIFERVARIPVTSVVASSFGLLNSFNTSITIDSSRLQDREIKLLALSEELNELKSANAAHLLQLNSYRDRVEQSLRDAKASQELVSALDRIMKESPQGWSSLIDLFMSKKHLIQEEDSTTSTAKFIKRIFETNENFINKEIYELFENVLLPNSLNFIKSIPHVHATLALIVNNNKEAQEFFCTNSFKVHVMASLPRADESLLKILNSLLMGNKKAQENFGTPDVKKALEFKFRNNTSQEFTNVIKVLNEQIIRVRLQNWNNVVRDLQEEIDEECLKKLAENEIDVADLLDLDASILLIPLKFTAKESVSFARLVRKINDKNNGVPVHQDPFKLQELEQIRQEHNDLRKLHQDLVTSSSKSIDDLKNQLQQEQNKLTAATKRFTHDLDDAKSQIALLQAEIHLLKQDKALPSDAPPPSRCFSNVRPAPFEESLRRLLALTDIPPDRADLNTYIPRPNTADLVLKYVNDNLVYLKGKPEIQDLVNNFGLTDDDIKAIFSVKIENPYPLYRWLNGHLTGKRGDKVASAIGPYFVLLYRALEKLPKIRAKSSRAVLIRDIPALRATYDNYETTCQPGKAMNFWGVSSFSRKDAIGANDFAGTPDEEAIIYSCAELEGVDLEPFRPQGMLAEYEILPLCPMVCRIQNVTKVGAKVVIGIRQCEHDDYSYAEPKK